MFKFLHAADIHLDSPLQGLQRYEGAPVDEIRQATRRAFENLVRLALDEQVAFVLLPGDLYDGDWKDYNTGLHFIAQMVKLRDARVPVFLIAGNHDAANRMTRSLRLPGNVRFLSADRPETIVLEDHGVAVHGQSFATEAVKDNLSERYPAGRRGYFNIGLLHTCATGRDGHERYAPCTIDQLRVKHYDYWALGHVHKREVLESDPPIVFPGNLQGRHIREAGPKGCYLVTVAHGRHVDLEFRALDVFRWELCAVDASRAESADALLEDVTEQLQAARQASDGRPLAVRVEVRGPSPAHEDLMAHAPRWTNEVRSRAIEVGGEKVWVEQVKLRTTPPADGPDQVADGPMGELLGLLAELRSDEAPLQRLRDELADLERKLPPELKQGPDGFAPEDPAWLRGLLEQVEPLLVNRLLVRGNGR